MYSLSNTSPVPLAFGKGSAIASRLEAIARLEATASRLRFRHRLKEEARPVAALQEENEQLRQQLQAPGTPGERTGKGSLEHLMDFFASRYGSL